MDAQLTVLMIDDNAKDVRLVECQLEGVDVASSPAERPRLLSADDLAAGIKAISEHDVDIVLLDLFLPDSAGLDTLDRFHDRCPDVPVIVLTGAEDEELGFEAIQAGAGDFLVKGHVDGREIVRAIRYVIERWRHVRRQERICDDRFRSLIEQNADATLVVDEEGIVLYANPAAEELFGRTSAEFLGAPFGFPIDTGHPMELTVLRRDGELEIAEMRVVEIVWSGHPAYLASLRDITERKRAQEALEWESEVRASAIQLSRILLTSMSIDEISRLVHDHVRRITGSALGMVGYIDRATGALVCPGFTPEAHPEWSSNGDRLVFRQPRGLRGWIVENKCPLLTNSATEDPRSCGTPARHVPIRRFLGVPALIDGELVGVLAVANAGRDYTTRDQDFLERMAALYALAIHREGEREELLRSETRLRTIFETSPVGITILDEDGRILQANRAIQTMLGYTTAELLGRRFEEITHPDDREMSVQLFKALIRGETSASRIEKRYLHRDGHTVWAAVAGTVVRGPDGEFQHLFTAIEDITERREAENRLRASEERFRSLVESIDDCVFTLDRSGTVTAMYGRWIEHAGIDPQTVLNRPMCELVGPDLAAVHQDALRRALANEHVVYDWSIDVEGRTVHFEVSMSPLRDSEGEIIGGVGVARDITAQKEAEQQIRTLNAELERRVEERTAELAHANGELARSNKELQRTNDELQAEIAERQRVEKALRAAMEEAERASQAKSEFLSHMSHELRTPLNSILGFAQLLELDAKPDSIEMDNIQHIVKAGRHLLQLIEEVLDLARIETGRISLSPEELELASVIGEAISIMSPLAVERHITILDEVTSADHWIVADRTRVRQVFLNLVSNAIKYNRDGGSVRITAEWSGSDRLHIAVADTGPGIPEDRASGLFEPFDRLGAEDTDVEGTGVGLAVSKRLVEAMGGTIGFESTPGAGSVFWIEMPRCVRPDARSVTTAERTPSTLDKPHRVLYIEDNPANLKLVQTIIVRRPNIRLLTAPQARIGLDLARAHRPDLILLDINLPEMDGFEALNQLRMSDETREIPVIALSARAMPSDIEKGLAAGFQGYLAKPLDVREFLHTLDAFLATT